MDVAEALWLTVAIDNWNWVDERPVTLPWQPEFLICGTTRRHFTRSHDDYRMTIIEYEANRDEIMRMVDEGIRQMKEDGVEPRYIMVGPESYTMLRKAIGERFERGAGMFETYQHVAIVLDPYRGSKVCVLPAPQEVSKGVKTYSF